MSRMQELINVYSGMRTQGIDARRALEILRPQINTLPQTDQAELVRQIRQLEQETPAEQKSDSKPLQIKPISTGLPRVDEAVRKEVGRTLPVSPRLAAARISKAVPKSDPGEMTCPQCGRANRADEVICYACGQLLQSLDSPVSTRKLGGGTGMRDSFFGKESVLLMMVRGSNVSFKVRPQKETHDLIIGRSDASVKPDIDLTEFGAGGMGVSRMHISIHYDARHSTLSVTDMNTLNGTYINGVQLHPQEVRVLRHGDELRMGQFVLTVHFYLAEG